MTKQTSPKYAPQLRECAARMVFDHQGEHASQWANWFNHRRLLEPIGNIPPAQAEARYYAQTGDVAMAA